MAGQADRIERALLEATSKVTRAIQLRAHQALVSSTPRDTSFAASSWTPTIGPGTRSAQPRPADRQSAESMASGMLSSNRARAQAIASSYRTGSGGVYIAGLASYLVYLNRGSSAQAAANFVERSAELAVRSVRNLRL